VDLLSDSQVCFSNSARFDLNQVLAKDTFVSHAIEEIRPRGICCVGASVQARSCAVQLAAFKVWVELRNTSKRVEVVVLSEKDIEEKL